LRAAELEIGKDASFVFKGENGFTLESGDYMIQGNKKTYLTSDGSLTVKYVGETHGRDNNGHYNETNFEFNAKDDEKIGMHAFIRVYKAGFALFRQHFFPVFFGNVSWRQG